MLVCKVDFGRDPVFLAGEQVKVKLTIENARESSGNCDVSQTDGQSNDVQEDTLAIATGQLACRCAVNGNKVNKEAVEAKMAQFFTNSDSTSLSNKAKFQLGAAKSKTSFSIAQDEKGYNVFCTKPEIICCDLSLGPQESVSFSFAVQLPLSSEMIPTSFNGHTVRFTYKLLFGFQKVGQPMQLIKCPIRVLTLCNSLHGENLSAILASPKSPSEKKDVDNPFVEESEVYQKSTEELNQNVIMQAEIAMQSLSHRGVNGSISGGGNGHVTYSVRNGQTEIAKFSLAKSCFRIGEEINGFFEFNPFPRYCLQYTVSLQCEEKLSEQFRLDSLSTAQPESFGSKCEYVADLSQCEVSLPIPHSVTPSFSTELVSFSWSLQFTFIISTESHPDIATKFTNTSFDEENDDQIINYGSPSNYETFSWTLPITLLPNNPFRLQSCSTALKRHHILNMS
ncbi:RAB6A-GEF complex partner protein 2-like [Convolutriloba macropyga]|uniref:RAB6A-GEF complex partner protein 2-like n=1 Tax=Convolutriloba macropyga TaxID=536237 RepID=UPI003F51F399